MRAMILLSRPSTRIGLGIGLVIVADEVEKTMHREMGQVVQENPVFAGRIPGQASHRP